MPKPSSEPRKSLLTVGNDVRTTALSEYRIKRHVEATGTLSSELARPVGRTAPRVRSKDPLHKWGLLGPNTGGAPGKSALHAPPPCDLAVLLAIPLVLILSGLLLSVVGYFDIYAAKTGFAIPGTAAERFAVATDVRSGRGGGEPLSVDATAFEQIRRTEYVVQPGDTISEIAYRFGLDAGTLLSMNPIDDVRRLLPGTELSIPDRDGLFHAVQPGESLASIASSYEVSVPAILDANDLDTTVLQVGDSLFIPGAEMDENDYLLAIGELLSWPVRNFRFTSGYGMRVDPITGEWRMHTGIDLANAVGTPILAALPGRVVHVDPNSGNYGHLMIIDHGRGFRTLYAHMSSSVVPLGAYVSRGQIIGRIGNTGRSTGPHLHFSVTRNGRWEDPLAHLP